MLENNNQSAVIEVESQPQDPVAQTLDLTARAKAAANSAEESQRTVTVVLADVQSKLTEVTSIASLALAAKTQISDAQAVIAAKSDHIQGAQNHSDKIRADLDRVLTSATQQANEIEGQRLRAASAADKANESYGETQKTKATVEADVAAIAAARKATEDSLAQIRTLGESITSDAQAKLADVSNVAALASATKTQITNDQAVIAAKSEHIQKAQEHADTVRASLDRELTAATQLKTSIEGFKSATQADAENSTTLTTNIRMATASAEVEVKAVSAAREEAEKATERLKGLAEKAATVEGKIAAYETRLAELDKRAEEQLKEIHGFLPGATSAGLAHAFNDRRQTFIKPRNRWQWIFVGSVLAIVGLTVAGLWHVFQAGTPPTYDELARLWLARLPVMVALVWLALHSSHESALAKRLEEDYGYKSAVAASFLGFHKQMLEVGGTVANNPPLAKLCGDTLTTIATPPGRIYDKHALSVSPAGELTQAAKAAAGVMGASKGGA